jgi:hypothetical protein
VPRCHLQSLRRGWNLAGRLHELFTTPDQLTSCVRLLLLLVVVVAGAPLPPAELEAWRDLAGRIHERVCKCIIAHLDSHPLPFAGMFGYNLCCVVLCSIVTICVPYCVATNLFCWLQGSLLAGCLSVCASASSHIWTATHCRSQVRPTLSLSNVRCEYALLYLSVLV